MNRFISSKTIITASVTCLLSLSAGQILANDQSCPSPSSNESKFSDKTVESYATVVGRMVDSQKRFDLATQCIAANADKFSYYQLAVILREAVRTPEQQEKAGAILADYASKTGESSEVLDATRKLKPDADRSRFISAQINEVLVADFDRHDKTRMSVDTLRSYLLIVSADQHYVDVSNLTPSPGQKMLSDYFNANKEKLSFKDLEFMAKESVNTYAEAAAKLVLRYNDTRDKQILSLIRFREKYSRDLGDDILKAQAELIISSQPDSKCPSVPSAP